MDSIHLFLCQHGLTCRWASLFPCKNGRVCMVGKSIIQMLQQVIKWLRVVFSSLVSFIYCYKLQNSVTTMSRDQPNSRFHCRDIFREIGLLRWKTPISMKSVKFREICDFSWILTLLHSFMKVFRVLSTAFVWILLFATCHTTALSSWHVFTVLLTYIQSWVLT